jgi:hypothetical protein
VKAKPSSFGFEVVVRPKVVNTAWFVPGNTQTLPPVYAVKFA